MLAKPLARVLSFLSKARCAGRGEGGPVKAIWTGLAISAHGYGVLQVNVGELPAGEGTTAFQAGMAARAEEVGDTRDADAPTGWREPFRPGVGQVDALVVV